jgi:mono/diheme cytochrome c family protein
MRTRTRDFSRVLLLLTAAVVALAALAADPEKGNEIFDEQCSSCHHAYSDERKKGPSLKLLFFKEKLESTGQPPTPANILNKIEKGGNGMPPFKDAFSEADKADLLAYLKTL